MADPQLLRSFGNLINNHLRTQVLHAAIMEEKMCPVGPADRHRPGEDPD